ncbi:hypothetical protein V8B97DRAFT_2021880 [Scleroderma yunnanense]
MTCGSPPKPDKLADRPFHRDPPNAPVLFHDSAPPRSAVCPQRFPGADPESTNTPIRIIIHNHISWHILFSYKQFHKIVPESHGHTAHHLLCLWTMGASGPVMDAAYATHYEYQRPAFESPLGRCYSAYLKFFKSELLKKDLAECLEEYILSPAANLFPINDGGKQSAMLSRFITVLYHPLIHVGYDIISGPDQKGCTHNAPTILSSVACDPRFSGVKEIRNDKILTQEYVEIRKFDITSDIGVANAVEELSWVNTMLVVISRAKTLLLTYFTSSLTYYVAQGRPELDFRKFYSGTEHLLYKVSGSPASGTLPNLLSDLAQTPNIWLSLIHPNPHLCYAQRALAHYSCLYGKQRKGSINTKLIKAGVEELDGTLFLRIAMLTQNRLGWMREGDPRSKLGF